ncbi:MAG: pantetheine-phosphate adenylyltransferase [Bacteroidaceae bacterium]
MARRFILAGSFDPFTIGHADLVTRALSLCDELLIGIGCNESKAGWIPVDERVRALRELYSKESRVQVEAYSCLTTDFAQSRGIECIVRGVRNINDYNFEVQMAEINRRLTGMETILLPCRPELGHVSSSLVRELVYFGKDITPYLPTGLCYIYNNKV